MSPLLKSFRALLVVTIISVAAAFANGQSMPGYRAPDKPKAPEASIAMKAARGQAPLRHLYGHLKADPAKIKRLGPLTKTEKAKKTEKQKILQVGVVRELPGLLDPLIDSAAYFEREGEVHVAAVMSTGARHTRIQFKDFSLPLGARVFVYSSASPNIYFGPYEGRGPWGDGTFWTPSLPGDQIVIEYTAPMGSGGLAPFTVSQIAHIYKDTPPTDQLAGACNLEVTQPWTEVAKSVGMIQFVTGGLVASCSGTLLNDSNTSIDHYVMTANHCINSQAEAQSAQMFWNYNSGESPGGSSSFGADLKVNGTASDFSLLRFGSVIPGLFYSGWDANPVATSTGVTGIHHPSGSHKRISFGATNANCPSWLGALCPNFTGVTWNQGVTEPGSSGSGIWTGDGNAANSKLVGTLTGGESSCSNQSGSDYYGRFSVTYPNVSAFLNGTNCVNSISPNSQNFPAGGGTGSFNITAPAGCSWSASSTAAWLTITSPASGTGNGTINFSVAASSELQRRGSIVAGTHLFNVNQAGGGACAPTLINYGQTINGALATSDCPLGDGTYVDAYSFNGTMGQQISILMTSAAFDTYLFLLNPDGSILRINDDDGSGGTNSRIPSSSGFLTLPATGSYTILANSFDVGATGAYSLTLTERPKRALTISSKTPDSGISVSLAPADVNGINNGTTTFGATYYQFTTVILNAQSTAGPNTVFLKWQKDGVDYSTSSGTSVTMDVDHTMTAVYGPTPTQVLTVASENPSGGVPITLTPNDNNGQGGGTTLFTRTYNRFTSLTLTAPISAGGNYFQKWKVTDGNEVNVRTLSTFVPSIDRTVTAVYVSVPPLPTPSATPTPNGAGQAVTYQINPAHTGSQFDSTIPPLAQRWSRNLGQTVSYPLIAGGKVFVTTVLGLHALDATTGATVWQTGDIGTGPAAAYNAGRVFVINRNGLLRAFDASNGTQVWSRQLSGQAFTAPPTAVDGTVYVNGHPTLYAVSEQDGAIRWSVLNAGGDRSSPAVSADGVYVAHSCNNTWALSPATGSVLWHYTTNCFGGGGKTPVLYAGRLYDRAGDHLVLHGSAGVPVATFSSMQAPAFNGATGYFKNGSTLEAREVVSGTLKWSFTGDGTLSSAPIVVNGFVYVGSTSGKLYAVSESSGASIWTGNVGAPVMAPDEQSSSAPAGLAAGEGLIVVPASNLLVAYASAPQLMTDSNNRVVAIDAVTFVRDPFRTAGLNNFSSDQRTRIMIFTTNVGMTQPSADLSVLAANIPLTVEAVGTLAGQPQFSYIIVQLDPALPTTDVQLRVIIRGVTTNAGLITIALP